MRSNTSQQIVPALPDPERSVSKKAQKLETPSIPDLALPAPGSSSHNPLFEDISKELPFLEQDTPSTPIYFQGTQLEEHPFESISFTSTQDQPNIVVGPSTIVHQPTPISFFPPPSFTFITGSSTSTT